MAWVVKAWRAERLVQELSSTTDILELERVARELSRRVSERRVEELSVPTTQPASVEQLERTRAAGKDAGQQVPKPPAPLPIPARNPGAAVTWTPTARPGRATTPASDPVAVPEPSDEPRVSRRAERRREGRRSSMRDSPLSELFKPGR
jgi:hypothetical protein